MGNPDVLSVLVPSARTLLTLGAVLGGLGVALGAFGAHGLENLSYVTPDRIATFRTGVLYHLVHALALLVVGLLLLQGIEVRAAGWLFVAGIAVFSGSLYVLVLADLPIMGAVTPIGGVAFIAGWGLLAWRVWQGVAV
ncbi:MAG: DUF423 domain-containing protein [Bacteroidota bacterium]